jgi:hypothetical protein
MSIFQPERKRITKTKDSLAEQGGLEPSYMDPAPVASRSID